MYSADDTISLIAEMITSASEVLSSISYKIVFIIHLAVSKSGCIKIK